jgi:hypothetical protein
VRPSILIGIVERKFTWFDPSDARAPSLTHEPGWFVMLELKSDPGDGDRRDNR